MNDSHHNSSSLSKIKSTSVSKLQFHLSHLLNSATSDRSPFWITRSNVPTHLVVPISALQESEELRAQAEKLLRLWADTKDKRASEHTSRELSPEAPEMESENVL